MSNKSYQENEARIPDIFEGIQVNNCKNPKCEKFGVEPLIYKNLYNSQAGSKRDPNYAISGLAKGVPGLKCKACNEITPIKSNYSIEEEKQRLSAYLIASPLSCPNESCINHNLSIIEAPDSYYKFGQTSGNQRYQCKVCRKTFSSGNKRRSQKRSEVNKSLYKALMNKLPVKRCCEFLEISPQTYYRKVDWLYEQALGFVRERERKLLRSFEMKRLYLSTDRQVHTSNWTKRDDKRNTELLALGTADNISGYVFGWHFNFDPRVSPLQIESETIELGDYDRPAPFRKHARLWLERDFESAQRGPNNTIQAQGSIQADIAAKYQSEVSRLNTEAVEEIDNTVKPPSNGMLVHSEYTMYGHFQLLNELFANTEKCAFT
ncbi:hypothetical protein [Alteromonas sp. Mac1]|uniref:hypothetical protein n=1 Tax=Alteromonas sp. Mac1 TaxID=1777491 RepID=UPI0007703329|nr:hypothetical protein [Alteromonas sp. Mac1]AMJ87292.1 hypothetical protein AV939_12355 [Alteromonas sp. Mac1]AMJ91154.1 hypothetical protein AV940_12115 [Alteromonas sp. Mac2]